jgi:hypothetical protein
MAAFCGRRVPCLLWLLNPSDQLTLMWMSIPTILGPARMVVLAMSLAILGGAGCHREPSASDEERLGVLKREFGSRYGFALDGDLYVRVVARDTVTSSPSEVERIYRTFMSDSNGGKRNTTFVYFNVYDSTEQFQYQLAFDPLRARFVIGNAEYY